MIGTTIRSAVLGVAVSLLAVGCCENKDAKTTSVGHGSHVLLAADMGADIKDAVAVIHGTDGNDAVKGWVKFSDAGGAGSRSSPTSRASRRAPSTVSTSTSSATRPTWPRP